MAAARATAAAACDDAAEVVIGSLLDHAVNEAALLESMQREEAAAAAEATAAAAAAAVAAAAAAAAEAEAVAAAERARVEQARLEAQRVAEEAAAELERQLRAAAVRATWAMEEDRKRAKATLQMGREISMQEIQEGVHQLRKELWPGLWPTHEPTAAAPTAISTTPEIAGLAHLPKRPRAPPGPLLTPPPLLPPLGRPQSAASTDSPKPSWWIETPYQPPAVVPAPPAHAASSRVEAAEPRDFSKMARRPSTARTETAPAVTVRPSSARPTVGTRRFVLETTQHARFRGTDDTSLRAKEHLRAHLLSLGPTPSLQPTPPAAKVPGHVVAADGCDERYRRLVSVEAVRANEAKREAHASSARRKPQACAKHKPLVMASHPLGLFGLSTAELTALKLEINHTLRREDSAKAFPEPTDRASTPCRSSLHPHQSSERSFAETYM